MSETAKSTAQWRNSQAAAAEVFVRLLPDKDERASVLGILMHAIRYADERAPASWVTTLAANQVRLNVGPAELITVIPGGVRFVLHRSCDWRTIKPHAAEVSKWGIYKTLKDSRIAFIESSRVPFVAGALLQAVTLSAGVAAGARSKTTWAAAHAPGVLAYLEAETEAKLPVPPRDVALVDAYMLQQQFGAFRRFASAKSGVEFRSFTEDPYVMGEEGYKYDVFTSARAALDVDDWREGDIGSGRIVDCVIRAIELPNNNLVPWQAKYGGAARPHRQILETRNSPALLVTLERALFDLYLKDDDEACFAVLRNLIGSRYPLMAYLFFIKDHSRYLPVAPETFTRALGYVGVDYDMSHQCDWANYSGFLGIMEDVRRRLDEFLGDSVYLLDAHSFLWILARQMTEESALPDLRAYEQLPATEREAITWARVGQGLFRQGLIQFWGSRCAVTGCTVTELLTASHIKPWKDAPPDDRLSTYNGLLLSPVLDKCFDLGYVSFDDSGRIMISPRLKPEDLQALGIDHEMKLRQISDAHRQFLRYHREQIFAKPRPGNLS